MILNYQNYNKQKNQVVIIGSGPAGISLALGLEKKGIHSLILEAGDLSYSEKSQENYKAEVLGDNINNPFYTRLRQFGGSSNHWGGTCLPLDETVFSSWPIKKEMLDPYSEKTCEILGINNYFNKVTINDDFVLKNLEGSYVNFATKYLDHIKKSKKINILFNSYFFKVQNNDKKSLFFKDTNNVNHKVNFNKLVIACGGIENSRILLLLQREKIVKNKNIGKYWMDHPIFYPADVILNRERYSEFLLNNLNKLNLKNSSNFVGKKNNLSVNKNFDNLDLRFFYDKQNYKNSGSIQLNLYKASSKTKNLILDLACVAPNLFSKINKNINKYCSANLHFTMEQEPMEQNQIILSEDKVDNFGLPSAILKINYSKQFKKSSIDILTNFGKLLIDNNLGRLAIDKKKIDIINNLNGNHHMGGTRIGFSKKNGVVDKNLKLFDSDNIYILGSSIFKTGGVANPTFTIVQLSLRLSDHLANEI